MFGFKLQVITILNANSSLLLLGGLDVTSIADVLGPSYVFVKLLTSIVELPAGGLRSGIWRFLRRPGIASSHPLCDLQGGQGFSFSF